MVLEHELSHETVQAFINIYPVVKDHGWKMMSLAQINGTWANRNPQGSLLRPIGNDDSSPQPMSKEESIMALIRSFRPERYWRTGDQEAYRHFGYIFAAGMAVVLLLCVLLFSTTFSVCRCRRSSPRKKIQID